ncbi:MAG: hypothetical protein C0613_13660 [Desulfobulbaceae bacterium]|nr:MAG: hypothetical protein C0613_13660 [Desulfobulbaceae bacterium]
MQKILRNIVGLLLLQVLTGCAVTHNFGPYIGKVVDAETKAPIEGAAVYITCSTKTPNPGGITSHYADFKEVLTDQHGEFHLELRVTTFRLGHLWKPEPVVRVFKPGYGIFPHHQGTKSDILVEGTSHILPVNEYVNITLPKLKTRKERRDNYFHIRISFFPEIPFEKRKNVFRLENVERVYLGFKPTPEPQ